MRRGDIELLAPAGSYESLKAAIIAGADAVYIGGNKFGARAYANNFTEQELLEAIAFAHLHGRKIYLTVNTLLKDRELFEELYAYLHPLYEAGLDAVIVQDIGVLFFIQENFKDLPIHASTQMTITNQQGVRFLKEQGVSRVVLSRELSLKEVKGIVDNTNIEIECFVHGALCYAYSGQCLLSSFIGGRSANKGQCAGPCRLPYQAKDTSKTGHLFSLKDICNVQHIPDLIRSGIHSFKIEGRMKRPEYVAAVVSIYRKYIDRYIGMPEEAYQVSETDMDILMEVYNRGGFHAGYLYQHNERDMLTYERPNHAGLPVMQMEAKGNARALKALHPGDVLEMPANQREYTLGKALQVGETMFFPLLKDVKVKQGTQIARIRNASLLSRLRKEYVDTEIKEKIKGKLILSIEKSATLILYFDNISLQVEGDVVERAKTRPISSEEIRKQVSQLGNTAFELEELEIQMPEDAFIPMKSLKSLRREAINQLMTKVLDKHRRIAPVHEPHKELPQGKTSSVQPMCYVLVETIEQLEVALTYKEIQRIYIDFFLYKKAKQNMIDAKGKKEIYLAMPFVLRANTQRLFEQYYHEIVQFFDGILIRNYDSYAFLKLKQYPGAIVTDFFIYNFNRNSRQFWRRAKVEHMTAPLEMNRHELSQIHDERLEMVTYGYLPMMISAGCIKKNLKKCDQLPAEIHLKDRYKKEFLVKNYCKYCYNIVYNFAPLWLCDKMKELRQLSIKAMRLQFVHESKQEMQAVLDAYIDANATGHGIECATTFTRGHFERGIR